MKKHTISFILGKILMFFAPVFVLPALVGLYFHDIGSFEIFTVSGLTTLLFGLIFNRKNTGTEPNLKKSEALVSVAISWIFASLICTVPYIYYGLSPLNALFESVSGITTTGATILTDFSIYPKTMFFWRSFTQWLGGMGIIVLFIAVLPQFAIAGRQMFSAEAPGPSDSAGGFTPRIKDSASLLWQMYLFFTITEIILLKFAGMPWFDCVCNSFSSLSGGGFSPHPSSISGYFKPSFAFIVTFFMFLSGMGYSLIYKAFKTRSLKVFLKNEEFMTYIIAIFLFSGILTGLLLKTGLYGLSEALRHGIFQVVSILTTTGFATADYTIWSPEIQAIMILLMFSGACAGSTSGGVKIIRLIFLFKYIKSEFKKILHPNAVMPVIINGNPVSPEITGQMISFLVFYVVIFCTSAFLITLTENSLFVGVTSSLAALGNTGPALGQLGPMGNFSQLEPLTKFICISDMFLGRLEIIPVLALFCFDFTGKNN